MGKFAKLFNTDEADVQRMIAEERLAARSGRGAGVRTDSALSSQTLRRSRSVLSDLEAGDVVLRRLGVVQAARADAFVEG